MSAMDLALVQLFLLISLFSFLLSRAFLQHWFTPISVFISANSASLGLYHLRFIRLNELSLETYALVVGTIVLYILGAMLAIGFRAQLFAGKDDRAIDIRGLDHFYYITAVLANLGWALAAAIIIRRFGLMFLLGNIWILQNEFQMQFIGYLNLLGILVAPTYVLKRTYSTHRRLDGWLLALAVFGLFLSGIKSYVTITTIAAGMAWSVARPQRFRARHLALVLVAVLVFFVFYDQHIDFFVLQEHEGLELASRLLWLQRPYLYTVGSWPAIDNLISGEVESPPRFGHVVLDVIWKPLSGLGLVEPYPRPLPFSHIGASMFNVYAFVGEVYWDLGLWPAMLSVWLLGLTATWLYVRARTCRYWAHQLVYALVGYGVFLSLFQYVYSFNFWFLVGYSYFVGFVIMRRGVFVDRRSHD